MRRIRTLALALLRDLYRSPIGAIPPVLAAGAYWLLFMYRVDATYLVTVGGFSMTVVAFATAFLLAWQANRAATYPFLLRLPRRSDLLAALVAATLASTVCIAVLFAGIVLVKHGIRLNPLELFMLVTRWLALFAFASVAALHLSQLVSRHRSHFVAFFVLGSFPTITDNQRHLMRHGLDWLARAATTIAYPIRTTITGALNLPLPTYVSALLLTFVYTAALGLLAAWLFRRKDLLWIE